MTAARWNRIPLFIDFQWDAARLLWDRQNPYDLSFKRVEMVSALGNVEANQFPSALTMLFPIALFPFDIAFVVWAILLFGFSVGCIYLALKLFFPFHFTARNLLLLTALLCASTPWLFYYRVGQHTLFAFFFFLLAIGLARTGRFYSAGISLAVALFKYTLIVPLLIYFLYKRWYRPLVVACLLHLTLHVWAAWWLGVSPWSLIEAPLGISRMINMYGGQVDIFAVYGRFLTLVPTESAVLFILTCSSIALITFVGYSLLQLDRHHDILVLVTLILLSNMVIYHSHYDFVVLFLVALWLFFDTNPITAPSTSVAVVVTALLLYTSQLYDLLLLIGTLIDNAAHGAGRWLTFPARGLHILLYYATFGYLFQWVRAKTKKPTLTVSAPVLVNPKAN